MGHNTQKNSGDIDGRVVHLSPPKQINDKLTLRTLVLEVFIGEYRREAPFIFKNARMDSLNGIKEGDWVNIQYQFGGFRSKQEGEPRWFAEVEGINCIKG